MLPISQNKSVKFIEIKYDYLSITFAKIWYQEDISMLAEQLLLPIMPITIQEKILVQIEKIFALVGVSISLS